MFRDSYDIILGRPREGRALECYAPTTTFPTGSMYLYSFYTWALGPSSRVGTLRPECIATYIYNMEPYKSSRVGNLEPSWGL